MALEGACCRIQSLLAVVQVLKYEEGQEYKVHSDVISVSEEDGVMRCATVLMYLTGERMAVLQPASPPFLLSISVRC